MRAGRRNPLPAAVLALLLAAQAVAAPDGGTPAVYAEKAQLLIPGGNWEESQCYPLPDAGEACAGAWLPEPKLIATARELEALRVENDALKSSPASSPQGLLIALGIGLVLGAAGGGYLVWQLKR